MLKIYNYSELISNDKEILNFLEGTRCDAEDVEFRFIFSQGRIRWIYEETTEYPLYLNTWNAVSLFSKIKKNLLSFLFKFGVVPNSKSVVVPVGKDSDYFALKSRFGPLGVFAGTPGHDRKFVSFSINNNYGVFIKTPISEQSKTLIEKELSAYIKFTEMNLKNVYIGKFTSACGSLIVEDLRDKVSINKLKFRDILDTYNELFSISQKSDCDFFVDNAFQLGTMRKFSSSFPTESIFSFCSAQFSHALVQYQYFFGNHFVGYLGHGDFTPWNAVRMKNGSVGIYDLEKSSILPKLFDLFHYLVSDLLLVKKVRPENVLEKVKILSNPFLSQSDFQKYFLLYVFYQVLDYLPKYFLQDELHEEAYGIIGFWIHTMKSFNLNDGVFRRD